MSQKTEGPRRGLIGWIIAVLAIILLGVILVGTKITLPWVSAAPAAVPTSQAAPAATVLPTATPAGALAEAASSFFSDAPASKATTLPSVETPTRAVLTESAAPSNNVSAGSVPVEASAGVAPATVAADMVPSPPIFGEGNVVDVARAALSQAGPKGPVFPRVIRGGVYSPDSGREQFETALLTGAPVAMGTSDFWSVFSYDGRPGDSCSWFFPLSEETANPAELAAGRIREVVFLGGQRSEIESPVVRLDSMMATCIVELQNVGARALTKNAGILSFVLVDGVTKGNIAVAFSTPPQFVDNFTGGDPSRVPAVIINGQPGRQVLLSYFNANGQSVGSVVATVETVNGTLSIEVPSDGGFVIVSMPVVGSNPNANTEVLFRMGSQPLGDIPGKNWVSQP